MPCCAIITCNTKSQTSSIERGGISFHRFPKEPNAREQWIAVTGRGNWIPTKTSTICSKHFTENDFIIKRAGYRYLKPGVIPREQIVQICSSSLDLQAQASSSVSLTQKKDTSLKRKNTEEQLMSSSNASTPRKRKLQKIIIDKEYVLNDLQEKFSLQDEDIFVLKNINVKVQELTNRLIAKNTGGGPSKQKYSPALRSFALTLDYYSPKAYEYVRKTFDTCLPDRRTLRKWYQNMGGDPGFTSESIEALKIKVKSTKHPIIAALSLDEMAIRRRIEWDGKKILGHVDIGSGIEGDHVGIAKEALVFLVTGINCNFKVPVGYFLVDGINGRQRADLIMQCLELIAETGIQIISLTFDGCAANMAMVQCLNCSIKDKKYYFPHPSTNNPVVVVLDPSHMIKLIRNAFQCYNTFLDKDGNTIEWRFLEELNNLQMKENFHLANKLRYHHVNFQNNKMKVKLATQLFSLSVADAIDFCRDQLNLPSFYNSQSTSFFLRVINNMFDIFNSRNTYEYEFKKALTEANAAMLLNYLDMATSYLSELRTEEGTLLIKSLRKTGFIGFIGCAAAVKHFYETLIRPGVLIFMPFYKVSQDHLEMLFGNIRSHGGGNNNPTARQFKAAYKKLLVHIELKALDTGNCTALEHISILNCASSPVARINRSIRRIAVEENDDDDNNNEEDINAFFNNISDFSNQIISHISGYIAHILIKKIDCDICIGALLSNSINEDHKFIVAKDKG
ncbi:hypothetical protein evm_015276, partial [Chilo suppressalis]